MTERVTILRTKQVCEKLSIGLTTLHTKYMKMPDFPKHIRVGGNNAWKESDIDSWLVDQFSIQNEVKEEVRI